MSYQILNVLDLTMQQHAIAMKYRAITIVSLNKANDVTYEKTERECYLGGRIATSVVMPTD